MSNPAKLRVIQWATGGVGKAAIECVLNHPQLELAGCWVHSADKNGRDVGEILGIEALGVTATSSIDEVLALDADCVVYSPLIPNDDEVMAILRSGKNVVTPVGWVYPDLSNPAVKAIADAAVEAGVTLHGSGIHPGGITERFPLMISSLSSAVTHVRAEEFSDIRTYNAPDVVRHIMGFGGTPEEAIQGPMASLLENGLQDVGANDRRPHGFSHRAQHQDDPGHRRGDRRHRLRPVPDHAREPWPRAGSAGRRSSTASR